MVNGIKKEIMFFMRGPRFYILFGAAIALAVSTPLMFALMNTMVGSIDAAAADSSGLSDSMAMFTNVSSSYMAASTAEQVTTFGTLIMFFMFKGTAGGEQQKRSIIIPQCSGLTPTMYVLPKFLFYIPIAFLSSFVAMLSGTGVSLAIFGGTPDWGRIMLSCLCAGVFSAFFASVEFTIGLCTGRTGIAVVCSILMQMLLPSILAVFRVDKFNPLALPAITETIAYNSCQNVITGDDLISMTGAAIGAREITPLNLAVSIGTAVVLGILMIFLTLYVLSAKQVDNKGNEPVL